MQKNDEITGSLREVVDRMNEIYPDKVDDTFNIGVNQRVIPVHSDDKIIGWKIQKIVGDVWVDLCDKVFNTMEELIENNKEQNLNEKLPGFMEE